MSCRLVFIALLLSTSFGCASVTVRGSTKQDTGVSYYEPQPYLLVAPDKTDPSKLVSQVVMLPDPTRKHVIDWSSGLWGEVIPNFKLTEGWNLTEFNSTVTSGTSDAIAALPDLIAAVLPAPPAQSAPPATSTTPNGQPAPPPAKPAIPAGLYRLNWTDSGWKLDLTTPVVAGH